MVLLVVAALNCSCLKIFSGSTSTMSAAHCIALNNVSIGLRSEH